MGLKTKRIGIISGLLVLMFILVASASAQLTIPTPPLPPIFTDLNITPSELELGDNVTISLDIMNPNNGSITYIVTIRIPISEAPPYGIPINETLVYVELEPYESKTVQHTIIPDKVGDFSFTVDGMTGSFVVKEPKKPFEVIVNDFQVHPLGIEVEDEDDVWTFRISYNVTNVGDYYGNYSVRSKIDGMVVDSNVFFLEAGETQSYLFEVERGIGTYQVEVEEFTESIEVTLIHKRSFWDEIPGFPYESIIIGLIAIISILRTRNL